VKPNCLFLFLFLLPFHLFAQNQAAYFTAYPQFYSCGKIDIPGNQLTVEALIKITGTSQYSGEVLFDIVSKHDNFNDVNYLLRPTHAELTTTSGFYRTSIVPADFSRDSFYHLAMTYDGA
jgi:hypothetical protein